MISTEFKEKEIVQQMGIKDLSGQDLICGEKSAITHNNIKV